MSAVPWIMITIFVVLILLAIFLIMNRKKFAEKPTDYRAFFIMGIAFLPIGIATKNYAFFVLGLVYMAIGLKNKDKWGKNIKPSKKDIENKMKLMWVILGLLILGGLAFFLFGRF